MAERYRDLQRSSLVETGIVQRNAGDGADRLSQAFSTFENASGEIAGEMRTAQGVQEGIAAGQSGSPAMRSGLRAMTAYGQAYNNAALRSYSVRVEGDADETAARLENEAGSDPEHFRAGFGAARDALLKEADPAAKGLIAEAYNRRLSAGVVRIIDKRALEVKNENRVVTKQGAQDAVERYARLRASGDEQGAEEERVKLELLLSSAAKDGTYTPAEVQILRREAHVGMLAKEESAAFSQELQRGGDALAYIERLKKDFAGSETLSSEEENQVVDSLYAEWRQFHIMNATQRAASVDAHASSVMDAYKNGQEAGTSALTALTGVPEGLKDDVRGKVLEALNLRRGAAREENVDTLVAIARAEGAGTIDDKTYVDVERMYDAGAYTPEQYANQLGALDAARKRKAGDVSMVAEVQKALASGIPLDPTDPDIKKALASVFEVETKGLEEGTPEWRATALAFAARTRTLPKQAIAWAEKMRRSPDPVQVIPAAQFLSSLHETAPQALEGVDERTRAFASLVTDTAGAGTDPKEAVDLAKKIVYETPKEVVEQLQTQYRADKYDATSDSTLNSYINDEFDSALAVQPEAPLEMRAAFNAQTKRYFTITRGDISKARALAWQDLKRNYGVSEVNGVRQMMMLPPENFGVTKEMVRADLDAFVTANPPPDGSTAEDLMIVPDSTTQRAAVDFTTGIVAPPSYKVFTRSGAPLYDRNGDVQRYYLPDSKDLAEHFKKTRAEAELKEQQNIDRVRVYRESRRDLDERRLTDPSVAMREEY